MGSSDMRVQPMLSVSAQKRITYS